MRALIAGVTLLLVVALPVARAGDGGDDALARALHKEAESLATRRRFAEALAVYERGYDAYRARSFLYNMGQAASDWAELDDNPERATANRRRAVYEWRRYLREMPEATNRAELEARIAVTEREIARFEEARDAEAEEQRTAKAVDRALTGERARHAAELESLRKQLQRRDARDRSERDRLLAEQARLRSDIDNMRREHDDIEQRYKNETSLLERKLADAERRLETERRTLRQQLDDVTTERDDLQRVAKVQKQRHQQFARYGWAALATGLVLTLGGSALTGGAFGYENGFYRTSGSFPNTNETGNLKLAGGLLSLSGLIAGFGSGFLLSW